MEWSLVGTDKTERWLWEFTLWNLGCRYSKFFKKFLTNLFFFFRMQTNSFHISYRFWNNWRTRNGSKKITGLWKSVSLLFLEFLEMNFFFSGIPVMEKFAFCLNTILCDMAAHFSKHRDTVLIFVFDYSYFKSFIFQIVSTQLQVFTELTNECKNQAREYLTDISSKGKFFHLFLYTIILFSF